MNITVILLSVIFAEILLIEPILSANDNSGFNVNKNNTANEPNGSRFQRILQRKKRFLIFPPGSSIVTTMSFTKTLVPRSPSGINFLGECDIYFPLQERISDWYPTKPPHPPPHHGPPPPLPPPPPPPPAPAPPAPAPQQLSDEEDEDFKQGVLPGNVGPTLPLGQRPIPLKPPQPLHTSVSSAGPNQLPTDQEIGITPGTIVSDPNFNVGAHPGEIYVDDAKKKSQTVPPRRYYNEYPKTYPSWPYHRYYPYKSAWNSSSNWKTYNDLRNYDNHRLNSYDSKSAWNRFDENVHTMQETNSIHSNPSEYQWQNQHRQKASFEPSFNGYARRRINRGARERRDIFDQLESFISFEQFDTRACILRMICEAKHYLLPPGKSLFQDIFRVLFTLPTEDETDDDYGRAIQASQDDCDSVYSKQCRFSVLGYLISKDRPIM